MKKVINLLSNHPNVVSLDVKKDEVYVLMEYRSFSVKRSPIFEGCFEVNQNGFKIDMTFRMLLRSLENRAIA